MLTKAVYIGKIIRRTVDSAAVTWRDGLTQREVRVQRTGCQDLIAGRTWEMFLVCVDLTSWGLVLLVSANSETARVARSGGE